jgi:hypothetical protein
MHRVRLPAIALAGALLFGGCADDPTTGLTSSDPSFAKRGVKGRVSHSITNQAVGEIAPFFEQGMAQMNADFAARGEPIRIAFAEVLLAPNAPVEMGTTIYANDRTKQLPYFWVPGDPRREADGTNLTYLVDESHSFAFTRQSFPAATYLGDYFASTFAPWAALPCGNVDLVRRPDTGLDPTVVDDGAGMWWLADIVVGGWLPLPEGVLGVTFTSWFINPDESPTDIDNDGRADTAFAEIWYNLGYYWTGDDPNATDAVDLQSVAIHENGHALGIGHFGKIFQTNANGKLHFAPLAIMNAAYFEPMQQLKGTDKASYCGNFASWP